MLLIFNKHLVTKTSTNIIFFYNPLGYNSSVNTYFLMTSNHIYIFKSSVLPIFRKHLVPKDIQPHHIFLQSSLLLIFSKHLVPKEVQPHIFLQSSMLLIFSKRFFPKDIQPHHVFLQSLCYKCSVNNLILKTSNHIFVYNSLCF